MGRKNFFLLVLCVIVVSAAQAQNYAPAVNYATQVRPRAVVAADFNGDGKLDLVVANSGSNTLSFLQGNGNGTFAAAVTIPLDGSSPIGLGTGDFNGDGKADLVVTYNDSLCGGGGVPCAQMEVLLGNGNGTFQAPIVIALPAPFDGGQGNGARVVVRDFNGDGAPDIAITGNAGGILLFLNSGGGNFLTPAAPVFNTGGTVVDFTVADFNKDGHLDIAFAANLDNVGPPNRTVGLSLGNGNGTFQLPVTLASGGLISGIAAADFNGDGLVDLVYTDPSLIGGFPGTINVGLQQANGSFSFLAGNNSVAEPSRIITGDFNGDGNQDFAVVESSATLPGANVLDQVFIFLGKGDGTFQAPTGFGLPVNPVDIVTASFTNSTALDLAIADFSADQVSVLVNQGGNTLGLQSSRNPEPADQPVTLQATVTATFSATGTPSGQVIFADGVTTLGAAPLNGSGVASLTVQLKGQGTHTILAVYGGDSKFVGGSSATFAQKVILAPSVATVVDSVNPSNFGQPIVFSASVTSFSGGSPAPTGTVTLVVDGSAFSSATLDATAKATFSVSTLTIGSHTVTVSYAGDSVYSSGSAAPLSQIVTKSLSISVLQSSANPSVFGQAITFMATVVASGSGGGVPSGPVTFFDAGLPIGTVNLDVSGQALVSSNSLAVGTHSITATYAGSSTFIGSSASPVSQVVNKSASAALVVSSSPASVFGQSVTFTTAVSASGGGGGVPSGPVTFLDGAAVIGAGVLDVSGKAALTLNNLSVGSHSITVAYPGDSNFLAAASPILVQAVAKAPTSTVISTSQNPTTNASTIVLSARVTAANVSGETGSVVFMDGAVSLGSGIVDVSGKTLLTVSGLGTGSHTLTAVYSGDSSFSGSQSSLVSETVVDSHSAISLVSSPNPQTATKPVTFAAQLTSALGGPVTTGTVTFMDGGKSLGSVPVGNSSASLTTTVLAVGAHQIIAVYQQGGSPGPFDGQSNPAAEIIQPVDPGIIIDGSDQDYTVKLGTKQATIQAGERATTQLTLTPVNGLAGNVSAICVGLPTGAKCVVNPDPVALDGTNAASATLTVETTGAVATAALGGPGANRRGGNFAGLYPFLAGILVLPLVSRKRVRAVALMAVLGVSSLVVVGCGGTRFETKQLSNTTPAGTYTVTVETTAGALTHSVQLSLQVK